MAVSILTVKTAIHALLTANSWPTTNPVIARVGPTEGEDRAQSPDMVFLGGIRDLEETYQILGDGTGPVEENYTLIIHIDSVVDGDDAVAAETRAWALYASLRALLTRNRNPVEQAGVMSVRLNGRTSIETIGALPGAWFCHIEVRQDVSARVFNP